MKNKSQKLLHIFIVTLSILLLYLLKDKEKGCDKIILPKSVKPERYDINLDVDMEPDFKFKGNI